MSFKQDGLSPKMTMKKRNPGLIRESTLNGKPREKQKNCGPEDGKVRRMWSEFSFISMKAQSAEQCAIICKIFLQYIQIR